MLGFCYFFTWYNVWMMKKTREIVSLKELKPNKLGHVFNVAGSLLVGFGFIENNNIIMIIGIIPIIYADILLTKTTKDISLAKQNKIKKEVNGPIEAALLRAIQEKKKEDPLIGLKVGSKEITQRLVNSLNDDQGVHIESLLGILGSLAGYSCQAVFREELIDSGKNSENEVFTIVSGKDGKNYYFSDLPNKPLAEEKVSIWGIITQNLGENSLPDIQAIFSHVAGSVGGDDFGIPQIPEKHKPGDLPLNYVKNMWEPLLPVIDKFCEKPIERPLLLGLAAQQVIEMGKDIISPVVAAQVVMECAIPMSKIGPEWLE